MTDTQTRLAEAFEGLGLTGRQAAVAAAGRDPAGPSGFDGMVARFRGLGMTESAAKVAAVGRDVADRQARAGFDAAARSAGSGEGLRARVARLEEALAAMPDAEVAKLAEAVTRRRGATVRRAGSAASTAGGGKRPAKKAAPKRVVVQESARDRRLAELRECLTRSDSIRACLPGR